MIKYVVLLAAAIAMTGCGPKYLVKKEIVTVNKPVPYCPAPPHIPEYEFQVDKLTSADAKDPGKVGQAYKADMLVLRTNDRSLRAALYEYANINASFTGVQQQIDLIFDSINKQESERVEALITK